MMATIPSDKKNDANLNTIFIGVHTLIWAIVLSLPYYLSNPPHYSVGPIPGLLFTLAGLIHAGIFYLNAYYLYPKLCNYKYWWIYVPTAILLIWISFQLKHVLVVVGFPEVSLDLKANKFIYPPSIGIFVASLIYRRVIDKINQEKLRKERDAERLAAELKFLRTQINPHFLFNVLTSLVSLARKHSDKLEPSLLMLSDLMRYMLYDSQQNKVPLGQEINYLKSYIELQKLRFGHDVHILTRIDVRQEADHCHIEPMLLIPFVENAFKHGTGWIDKPEIAIFLLLEKGTLTFKVSNKHDQQLNTNKEGDSGIGLVNVKTRLDLLYKGRYQLKINQQDHLFNVTLILQRL